MCSPSRRISKCGQGNYPTVVCYVILCLVICVHHSHQENNLSLDKIKDEENNHNAANVSLDLNLSPIFPDHDHSDPDHAERRKGRPPIWNVWLASAGSITVIALCEVFAVLVVPIMQRVFYQHIIQFLIALAIGSLLGDATLHLIPHALLYDFHGHDELEVPLDKLGHSHVNEQAARRTENDMHNPIDTHKLHEKAVWLGLVVMISLISFFSFERIVNKLGEWREGRKREQKNQKKIQVTSQRSSVDKPGNGNHVSIEGAKLNEDYEEKTLAFQESVLQGASNHEAKKVKIIRSGHRPTCDMVVGERVCKHRYSSICVDDIEEIMNEEVNNCPKPNEECCLITANNNDNIPCRSNSFRNPSTCLKNERIFAEKVPENVESQIKDIAADIITYECVSSCEKPLQDVLTVSEHAKYEKVNGDNELSCVTVPEASLAEKLMKAKRIFMNSPLAIAEIPSESSLVDKMKIETQPHEIDENCQGTMSTANSQTPFFLPISNSYPVAQNGDTKSEIANLQESKSNALGLLHDRPHNQVFTADTNLSNKGDGEYKTVYVNEHEHFHHGHSHAHTHLHSAPDSISSVAWMVLLGDGVHSLADGLAIGAAFSDSMTSGLSTALAVLCHELPHVVGDFAMLLRAGMSSKQAIFYKFLSSGVSYMGMIIGILLGERDTVIPWILAATAGIFIYIALVDMMPELNSGHRHPISDHAQHDSHLKELCLQLIGMSLGTIIMLVIALHEESISKLISEPAS